MAKNKRHLQNAGVFSLLVGQNIARDRTKSHDRHKIEQVIESKVYTALKSISRSQGKTAKENPRQSRQG